MDVGLCFLTRPVSYSLIEELRQLLLGAHYCLDKCLELEIAKLPHVDILEGMRMKFFNLNKGGLQIDDLVSLHKYRHPLSFLTLDSLLQHLLLVNCIYISLSQTLHCDEDLYCKCLLLRMELCRIRLENYTKSAEANQVNVLEVVYDKLCGLRIILQGLRYVHIVHIC